MRARVIFPTTDATTLAPGVDLTYVKLSGESDGAAGDKYIGLNTFGRVVDQRWTTSGGTAKDRRQYGYLWSGQPQTGKKTPISELVSVVLAV